MRTVKRLLALLLVPLASLSCGPVIVPRIERGMGSDEAFRQITYAIPVAQPVLCSLLDDGTIKTVYLQDAYGVFVVITTYEKGGVVTGVRYGG